MVADNRLGTSVQKLCLRLFLQERLKLVTVLGAGLLCGTALAVIIPEGVHALYEEILEGRVRQCFTKCISINLFSELLWKKTVLHFVVVKSSRWMAAVIY